ncbi:hypothetical protein CVN76_18600 [Bacillus sp. mrc49]|nr:hypothetical protein CVN76_18600 [Bacillus sp. mrc49]
MGPYLEDKTKLIGTEDTKLLCEMRVTGDLAGEAEEAPGPPLKSLVPLVTILVHIVKAIKK